jgi:hypothetical protein
VTRATLVSLSGSAGAVAAGLGIAQLLHGHPWGYLLLAAGLLVSVPYYVRMVRDWPRAMQFLCPRCGSPFLWAQVGLTRKRNRMPKITSIHGLLICASCDQEIGYSDFLEAQGVFDQVKKD